MATADEELKKVYGVFSDVWKFFRKFADVQQEDGYWRALVDEADMIAKKHQDNKLCHDLILAAVAELERKGKRVLKMT